MEISEIVDQSHTMVYYCYVQEQHPSEPEDDVEPPTYNAFETLLNPEGVTGTSAQEPEPLALPPSNTVTKE